MIRRINRVEWSPGQFIPVPLNRAEQESDQDLNVSSSPITGGNYEYDLLGTGRATKGNAIERVSFLFIGDDGAEINSQVDTLRRCLFDGGRLKLWNEGSEADEHDDPVLTSRWAYARIRSMPQIRVGVTDHHSVEVTVIFSRSSDWSGEDALASTPYVLPDGFTVYNPGNAPVYDALLTLDGDYDNPVLLNTTTGYRLRSTRTGTDPLRFDAGRTAVERYNGSNWVNDYDSFVRQQGRSQLMRIDPGYNEFTADGINSGTLALTAFPKWF